MDRYWRILRTGDYQRPEDLDRQRVTGTGWNSHRKTTGRRGRARRYRSSPVGRRLSWAAPWNCAKVRETMTLCHEVAGIAERTSEAIRLTKEQPPGGDRQGVGDHRRAD